MIFEQIIFISEGVDFPQKSQDSGKVNLIRITLIFVRKESLENDI